MPSPTPALTEDRAERLGAASGFAVLAFGAAAISFERSPVTAADFLTHRTALLTQSMLFIAGAAATLWFLGSLRAHLQRAEGGSGRLSAVVFGSGVAWVTMNLLAQAFQVGAADARSAAPDALLRSMAAVFTVANLPLAVMLLATATITLRHRAFPAWLGWLAAAAAAAQALLWIATVIGSGPLAPGGWLSSVLYPFFLIWLIPATVVMIRGTASCSRGRPRTPTT